MPDHPTPATPFPPERRAAAKRQCEVSAKHMQGVKLESGGHAYWMAWFDCVVPDALAAIDRLEAEVARLRAELDLAALVIAAYGAGEQRADAPAERRCLRCKGNGRIELLEHCPVCHGSGMVKPEEGDDGA